MFCFLYSGKRNWWVSKSLNICVKDISLFLTNLSEHNKTSQLSHSCNKWSKWTEDERGFALCTSKCVKEGSTLKAFNSSKIHIYLIMRNNWPLLSVKRAACTRLKKRTLCRKSQQLSRWSIIIVHLSSMAGKVWYIQLRLHPAHFSILNSTWHLGRYSVYTSVLKLKKHNTALQQTNTLQEKSFLGPSCINIGH